MPQLPALALAFATIERPQVVQRLILSVRKYFPELPIYVADQSRQVDAMSPFYAAHQVTLVRMPYDIGVTASRNRLAREVKEEYLILCDDDFIFGPRTSFAEAVKILEADADIGVVGGRLFDFDGETEAVRNWELFLEYDAGQKILFSIPIYELAPKVRELGGIRYYLCDAVMNFAVFRRSMLSAVQWDERFKSNGEHEDFYLNLKVNTSFKVAYLPTMVAYHHHPEVYQVYRARLRERNGGWKLFLEKWGLEQHIEYGLGVRTIDDVDTVTTAQDARARFFINPDLSLHRPEAQPGTILIGDFKKISAIGILDKDGHRAGGGERLGRLLVDPRTSNLVSAPTEVPDGRSNEGAAPRSEAELFETYGLESSRGGQAVSAADEPLYFRYDPILRSDTEFFLWYFCAAPAQRDDRIWRRLSVVARWWASDGTNLVWKSRRMFLDLRSRSFWRPLFLEVPVPPRGCRWLRFDLVTDGGPSPNPVCTGFLFGSRAVAATGNAFDVLGLGRLPNDGTNPGGKGHELEELGRGRAAWPITLPEPGVGAEMSILGMDRLAGLEALYFVGWEGLGRALVSARLPAARLPMPAAIALPKAGWSAPGARIYGFGGAAGFVALSW
jgi:hypothetical protein